MKTIKDILDEIEDAADVGPDEIDIDHLHGEMANIRQLAEQAIEKLKELEHEIEMTEDALERMRRELQ